MRLEVAAARARMVAMIAGLVDSSARAAPAVTGRLSCLASSQWSAAGGGSIGMCRMLVSSKPVTFPRNLSS